MLTNNNTHPVYGHLLPWVPSKKSGREGTGVLAIYLRKPEVPVWKLNGLRILFVKLQEKYLAGFGYILLRVALPTRHYAQDFRRVVCVGASLPDFIKGRERLHTALIIVYILLYVFA